MKILYILDRANLYGSEVHVMNLIEDLQHHFNILIITFDNGPLLDRLKSFSIESKIIKCNWIPNIFSLKELHNTVKKFNPDIIHGHQPKALFWTVIIGKYFGIRTVTTFHFISSRKTINEMNKVILPLKILGHKLLQIFTEILSTNTIFVSYDSQKNSFLKKKSIVIYNWVNPQDLISREFQTEHRILVVSSITPLKGFNEIINVLILLQQSDLSFTVDFLGDGEIKYITELKKKLTHYNVKFNFHGYVIDKEDFYKRGTVFLLLSNYETFGLAYIEAASYGLPIIARNLKVLQELLPEGNILENDLELIKDKLIFLLENKSIYDELVRDNQYQVQSKFSRKVNINKIIDLYIN